MAFRFSLGIVLRLRRSLEDAERLRLQKLQAERVLLDEQLSDIDSTRTTIISHLQSAMRDQPALPGSELQFATQRLWACDLQRERLSLARARLQEQIIRQQEAVLQRRRERQLLEQVRDQQRSLYKRGASRQAQAQIEELFLLRHIGAGTKE